MCVYGTCFVSVVVTVVNVCCIAAIDKDSVF